MGWLKDAQAKRDAAEARHEARLDRFDNMNERTVRGNELLLAARVQQHALLERIAVALEKIGTALEHRAGKESK